MCLTCSGKASGGGKRDSETGMCLARLKAEAVTGVCAGYREAWGSWALVGGAPALLQCDRMGGLVLRGGSSPANLTFPQACQSASDR